MKSPFHHPAESIMWRHLRVLFATLVSVLPAAAQNPQNPTPGVSVTLQIPKSVEVNVDDDNKNEEWDKDDSYPSEDDDDLVVCTVSVSTPDNFQGNVQVQFIEGGDKVKNKFWKDARKSSEQSSWQVAGKQLSPSPANFYLEGHKHSDNWDDVKIKAVLTGTANGIYCSAEYVGSISVVQVDADVDSLNDSEYDFSFTDLEDKIEDCAKKKTNPQGQEVDKFPGKVVFFTEGDVDLDGVPDFADGFKFQSTDVPTRELTYIDEDSRKPKFTPLRLELKQPFEPNTTEVKFIYTDINRPDEDISLFGSPIEYNLTKEGVRIWRRDFDSRRGGESVPTGDLVPVDEQIKWSDLSDTGTRTVDLFIEYVAEVEIPEGRRPIRIEVKKNDIKAKDIVNVHLAEPLEFEMYFDEPFSDEVAEDGVLSVFAGWQAHRDGKYETDPDDSDEANSARILGVSLSAAVTQRDLVQKIEWKIEPAGGNKNIFPTLIDQLAPAGGPPGETPAHNTEVQTTLTDDGRSAIVSVYSYPNGDGNKTVHAGDQFTVNATVTYKEHEVLGIKTIKRKCIYKMTPGRKAIHIAVDPEEPNHEEIVLANINNYQQWSEAAFINSFEDFRIKTPVGPEQRKEFIVYCFDRFRNPIESGEIVSWRLKGGGTLGEPGAGSQYNDGTVPGDNAASYATEVGANGRASIPFTQIFYPNCPFSPDIGTPNLNSTVEIIADNTFADAGSSVVKAGLIPVPPMENLTLDPSLIYPWSDPTLDVGVTHEFKLRVIANLGGSPIPQAGAKVTCYSTNGKLLQQYGIATSDEDGWVKFTLTAVDATVGPVEVVASLGSKSKRLTPLTARWLPPANKPYMSVEREIIAGNRVEDGVVPLEVLDDTGESLTPWGGTEGDKSLSVMVYHQTPVTIHGQPLHEYTVFATSSAAGAPGGGALHSSYSFEDANVGTTNTTIAGINYGNTIKSDDGQHFAYVPGAFLLLPRYGMVGEIDPLQPLDGGLATIVPDKVKFMELPVTPQNSSELRFVGNGPIPVENTLGNITIGSGGPADEVKIAFDPYLNQGSGSGQDFQFVQDTGDVPGTVAPSDIATFIRNSILANSALPCLNGISAALSPDGAGVILTATSNFNPQLAYPRLSSNLYGFEWTTSRINAVNPPAPPSLDQLNPEGSVAFNDPAALAFFSSSNTETSFYFQPKVVASGQELIMSKGDKLKLFYQGMGGGDGRFVLKFKTSTGDRQLYSDTIEEAVGHWLRVQIRARPEGVVLQVTKANGRTVALEEDESERGYGLPSRWVPQPGGGIGEPSRQVWPSRDFHGRLIGTSTGASYLFASGETYVTPLSQDPVILQTWRRALFDHCEFHKYPAAAPSVVLEGLTESGTIFTNSEGVATFTVRGTGTRLNNNYLPEEILITATGSESIYAKLFVTTDWFKARLVACGKAVLMGSEGLGGSAEWYEKSLAWASEVIPFASDLRTLTFEIYKGATGCDRVNPMNVTMAAAGLILDVVTMGTGKVISLSMKEALTASTKLLKSMVVSVAINGAAEFAINAYLKRLTQEASKDQPQDQPVAPWVANAEPFIQGMEDLANQPATGTTKDLQDSFFGAMESVSDVMDMAELHSQMGDSSMKDLFKEIATPDSP